MAALGRLARTQIGQICSARSCISAASFRTTAQAVLDRIQILSGPDVVPETTTWESSAVTDSAWRRSSIVIGSYLGHTRGYASNDGEERRVDSMVREELEEPEGGPEPGLKEKAKEAVHVVGQKVDDTGKAIKDATDSEGIEKAGEKLQGAGKVLKDKSANKPSLGKEDVVTT